jgi:hypothetical protein
MFLLIVPGILSMRQSFDKRGYREQLSGAALSSDLDQVKRQPSPPSH